MRISDWSSDVCSSDLKAAELWTDWAWWRRDDQCPPEGDWHVWMLLAGRGFGKTRTGAEWIRGYADAHPGARIALVAASLHEGRQVMIAGESGLLAIAPDSDRPAYESRLRRLSRAKDRTRHGYGKSVHVRVTLDVSRHTP